jgi:hypothetical protein
VSRTVSDAVMDGLELAAAHRPATMGQYLNRLGLAAGTGTTIPPAETTGSAGTAGTGLVTVVPPVTPPYQLPPPPVPMPPPPIPIPAPLPPPPTGATGAAWVRAPGRWKVTLPAYSAAAALGAAAPVLVNGILAAAVLPSLATAGDAVVFVRHRRLNPPTRLRQRVPVAVYAVARYLRNLLSMVWTAVPALVVIGLLVAASLLLDGSGASDTVQDWVLRAGGAGVALLLLDGVLANRLRYQAGVIEDMGRSRLLRGSGRLTPAGWMFLAAAAVVIAVALAMEPELWPLRR